MGEQDLNRSTDKKARKAFIQHLLEDVEVLEQLLHEGRLEHGITRIGAEQEFCLVDQHWRPSTRAPSILPAIDDPHFTTELAKYNLEINLDPFELRDDVFRRIEAQLEELLDKAKSAAAEQQTRVVLAGILPTITADEVGTHYMTEHARYFALNEMFRKFRATDFHLKITGVEDLVMKHHSIMFESCNTSFQMHLQIDPDDFARSYNWAQALAGPVLAQCVNSPILLGMELWQETRIALFQQSVDIRDVPSAHRDQQARVAFGEDWVRGSIADFYKNEISRYRILLSRDIEESSSEKLKNGQIPKLKALNLHNGTIYKWNRPCYGVGGGKAHIRIENRYVPSGPTVLDEMANFAFWVGLMMGRTARYDRLEEEMEFNEVKSNFVKAARYGTETYLHWMGETVGVKDLVKDELLPMARAGLEKAHIDPQDIARFLGVIEQRIEGHTPAQWLIRSYRNLKKQMKKSDALTALTRATYDQQQTNRPAHLWPLLKKSKTGTDSAARVGHIMSSRLFTAYVHDTAALTLKIMEWKNIHHVPVVDHKDKLVGLLTWSHIGLFREEIMAHPKTVPVSQIMEKTVFTAETSTPIREAVQLMNEHGIGCLPVLQKKQLVGIITRNDLVNLGYE